MERVTTDRRTVLGGAAMIGAGIGGMATAAPAAAQGIGTAATMEPADAWMDRPNVRHRMAFDCTSATAAAAGLGYANNYIHTSGTGYGTTPQQLAVVVVLRSGATPFAYSDAMWAKHGRKFARLLKLTGDQAIRGARENPLLARAADADPLPKESAWTGAATLSGLAGMGVQFVACGLATDQVAQYLAGRDGNAAAIRADLATNLVPNGHLIASGIVAVGHLQEHGYPIAYVAGEAG